MRSALGILLVCLQLAGCGEQAGQPADEAPAPDRGAAVAPDRATPGPRLVLLLAIDQLRRDRLSPSQPGGLGRLQREGRVFVRAALAHAFTETCPGHATMLTGRHPADAGIPGNRYVDPKTLVRHYCVEDSRPEAAVVGRKSRPDEGRSPRNLRVETLGDWMKAQRPATRVFSVSAKDRAAVAMGGQHPDGVYWFDQSEQPRMTTSRYYAKELPAWVAAWGPERVFEGLPDSWVYREIPSEPPISDGPVRPDDYAAESPQYSRFAPHPLLHGLLEEAREGLPADLRLAAQRLYASPFMDATTLAFAKELVVRERVGTGPDPDLLAVSLSATDIVGHMYGPESWESRESLARLDAMVGDFLEFLERRVGAGNLLVVLTADHGVLPIPEWLLAKSESTCALPGGRGDPKALEAGLAAALDRRFGAAQGEEGEAAPWFGLASVRLTLNRERIADQGLSEADVLAAAEAHLEAQPGIDRVWTREEVAASSSELAPLYAHSWDPERGGDLALQTSRDCLFSPYEFGTSHGSPWEYDRAVPLVFYGPGVTPARVDDVAATVDIAPTLAARLGVEVPEGLAGRVLPLR